MSVTSEWLYSTAGNLYSDQRSQLAPERAEMLLFIRENIINRVMLFYVRVTQWLVINEHWWLLLIVETKWLVDYKWLHTVLNCCSTDSFKRALKTFSFQSAYGCETRVSWLL